MDRKQSLGLALIGLAVVFVVLAKWLAQPEEVPLIQEPAVGQAETIVQQARDRRVSVSYQVPCELRQGSKKKMQFTLLVDPATKSMLYKFVEPQRSLEVRFGGDEVMAIERLGEREAGRLGVERLGEPIGESDLIYADLVQSFWNWPNPKLVGSGEERVSIGIRRDAWVLRLDNPNQDHEPHAVVKIWIDKESNGLLRVQSYDSGGRMVRRYQLSDVQKDRALGTWVAETIRVTAIDQVAKKKITLDIEFGDAMR